ncbi:SpoVK/Ycf46/Vps4 family AAA+-type ATPase [Gracilibacillus halotolerans]|uniref:SpoVK/Ycf46/Vps4 family AAA+-type ATPase n=1 Tax=Gracilibacillus halotolerans TaxID=74386 RepID=A0A841RG09_9BACI|nr:AAA family ATPase [Gracilibacillus halotolerans]MBB6511541.1 SpoVK/Ycf46/Vps4 family AAA+-type ATPase [Gracilibacillus halotolerans]
MEHNEWGKNREILHQWKSIEKEPPFTEIGALRLLDEINEQKEEISVYDQVYLYSVLIYHRMKRDVSEDVFISYLASYIDEELPDVARQLLSVKKYFSFYTELEELDFNQYYIRETDFDPVKLKKAKAFLNEISELRADVSDEGTLTEDKLTKVYDELLHVIDQTKKILNEVIFLLEQRRSGHDMAIYNEMIDKLKSLIIMFHEYLPSFIKEEQEKDPIEQLDEMIGLVDVKQFIHQYYHYLKYQKKRKEKGFQMIDEQGLNMVITGNPGTGKTTIARLLADIYYQLGLLDTNQVIEVTRSQLIGSFMGQTEENTLNYIKKAIGGVLFIDEAYNLKREDQTGNDYGQAVIDTIVSAMTSQEYQGKFALIIAGYPEEMRHFLWSNQGLRSRFPDSNFIELPNFNDEELMIIAEDAALRNDYYFTTKARERFKSLIEKARVDDSFGNARTVNDLVLKVIFHIGASKNIPMQGDWLDHMRISLSDIEKLDEPNTDKNPNEQLDELIGLSEIKEEVKKLSAFVTVQQERKVRGLPSIPIQLHSVFSGNPGTGKTTVAKIFAQILKQCGLLKRGHLVIASRTDLVAGYVGQTAIKTRNKIREALGGVLFIDEAYALNRGQKDFGKEAIDTIVDEMTKHNENLVIILAGYKNEMEEFISSNPGLESRFKKYFHFQDYTAKELLEMTRFYVDNYKYHLEDEALDYLKKQYEEESVAGNGRFVVNLINEAAQYQAFRIQMDNTELDKITILTREDIELAWKSIRGKRK